MDPCCHRDRESVLASLGSGSELVKCVECSERGRKVFGVMGKRTFNPNADKGDDLDPELGKKIEGEIGMCVVGGEEQRGEESGYTVDDAMGMPFQVTAETGISLNGGPGPAVSRSEVEGENGVSLEEHDCGNLNAEGCVNPCAGNEEGDVLSPELGVEEKKIGSDLDVSGNGAENVVKESEFLYGEEVRERFNGILKRYEGTHNFHNFTTRTKAEDPSAKRYIISFDAKTTVTVQGMEFVKCEVVGQSFMLHQIRKMVGLAVAIMRNCAPESLIETALQQ